MGRRCDDDERQISRWAGVAGKTGRFRIQVGCVWLHTEDVYAYIFRVFYSNADGFDWNFGFKKRERTRWILREGEKRDRYVRKREMSLLEC